MAYSILCSDLDGTLLTTKDNVSEVTIKEIERIKDRTKVILVSARMPKSMVYLQERLAITSEPIICYNGALVLDGDRVIDSTIIPMDVVNAIYTLADELEVALGLYFKDEWYVEKDSERVQKEIRYTHATPTFKDTNETILTWETEQKGAHKIMLMGTKESADALYPILEAQLGKEVLLYRSNDTLIEIAPSTVSKLSAISLLLQEEESLEKVIAFGDNYNDIEMLKHVGCGVAVGNAREEVKAIANYIALPNTEDGVAQFIREHM